MQPVYGTDGGFQTATIYSGIIAGPGLTAAPGAVAAGSDVLLFSGAGRLNQISFALPVSGVPIQLYDAAAPVSGGPIYTSGHKLLATTPGPLSGRDSVLTQVGMQPNMPFQSGLCVSTRSGMPATTFVWTPELAGTLVKTN